MSSLESEVLKFQKKDFEVVKRRTLKYGKVVLMERKKSGVSGFLGGYGFAYLYFADGDSNTRSITEFLKHYTNYFVDSKGDEDDRGYFFVNGAFDKGLFNDLRRVIVKDNDVRNTIVVKQFESSRVKQKSGIHEEKINEKIVEREMTRRSVKTEEVSFPNLVSAIKSISFVNTQKERGYENQLYQYLGAKGFDVQHERSRRGARFDLVVGNDEVAIELKVIKSASQFDALFGQINRYKNEFNNIIVVLRDELRNPSVIKQEKKRIEEIDPKNIAVLVK